jgi:hypothetical protein
MRTRIKPPIIINEHGSVFLFQSVEDAEMYLEAVDVENNEYVAYDSEGRLLRLVPKPPHEVIIRSAEQEPGHSDELHATLFKFLLYEGAPADRLRQASLRELVEKASGYEIDLTRKPLDGLRAFFRRWLSR